jgi:integrase
VGKKRRTRGNGEGTVYARKNKHGKITSYRGEYGEVGNRQYVSAKTKTECWNKLRAALNEYDPSLDATTRVEQYLNAWLQGIKDTVRIRSWERYEQLTRKHIIPALGKVKLKDLKRARIRDLYRSKLDEGLAARTVQYIHTTLHKALKQAELDGLITSNPSDGIKPSNPRKQEIHPLTEEQATAFLQAARGDRYEALYELALRYGLRQGELLGLKWEDLQGNTLLVRRTMSEVRDGRIEEETKSGKGRRVELSPKALEALRSHRARQNQESAATDYQESGLIFATSKGTPVNSKNLYWRSFKPLLKSAGLPDIRFHDLRHTCATIRLMRGQKPTEIQYLLGHSSVAFTLDKYTHSEGHGKDVMEDLG